MKSTPDWREKHENKNLLKKEVKLRCLSNTSYLIFYSTSLTLTILFSLHLINHNTDHINITHSTINTSHQNNTPEKSNADVDDTCDLFNGRWVEDGRGALYTNHSCRTIPFLRNCFLHGRKDRDFLHWRWKPEGCELGRFDPRSFLTALRGKTMAFIGDSLARNQMESLLCLLSTAETPNATEKDPDDRFATWVFPNHNFTLMALWSQFLVAASERLINGSASGGFNLHLDRVDPSWSQRLPSIDYAVFSDAHWFFRQNYLYEGGRPVGCVYCQSPGVPDVGPGWAMRMAFRAAFRAVNDCRGCRRIHSLLRTYSPSHFENGTWNTGGGCPRTRPVARDGADVGEVGWEYREIQLEEIEKAKKDGEESGNSFEVLNVTEMMSVRRDGHPGVYWGNKWMKGYSDCIHWCLPGPVDVWNELLFEVIKRRIRLS